MPSTLIDTNALLWYALDQTKLSQRAAEVIRQLGNCYSHVSLWEMAIKSGIGKLVLESPDGIRWSAKQFLLQLAADLNMTALGLEFDDFAEVEALPPHHKDPFDRLLVVQARRYGMSIVSADPIFERYGIKRAW